VNGRLYTVHEKLVKEGNSGPRLRLLPTTAGHHLRGGESERRSPSRNQGNSA